jgi:hypothetical protein
MRVKLTRDGKPITATVINPETGEPEERAVTDELVDPRTRAKILEKVLAMCGLVAPTSTRLAFDDKPGDGIRAALADSDPELVRAIAEALGEEY